MLAALHAGGTAYALPSQLRQPTRSHNVRMAAEPPHVAVVGGGWGGWGAAKALVENGCKVTLLDAIPDPTGATPYLTPSGKPF